MKPKLYLTILLAVLFLAISCRTAKKMYEKGHYDEAVELAAKKLQKDPDDPKLLSIIREAYTYASDDHHNQIRTLGESTNELKWEWIYHEYAALQKMYEAIYRVPSVYKIVQPENYSSALVSYGEKAGDVRFDRGMNFMQFGDKASYKNAYRELQLALQFKPGHRDIMLKLDEAFELAVTNVVVMPLQQNGGFLYSGYTLGGQNIDDKLLHELQVYNNNDLVRFYSAWDARSQRVRADQVLDMRLMTFNLGATHDRRDHRRVSKEVVIKETVYKPDSVVKEYGKVYADITTTRRMMQSDMILQVSVREENGGWLWGDDFRADHNWSTEFATFTGDARALSDSDKDLVNRRREFPPGDEEVMRYLLQQVSNDAVYRIKNYFTRY